MRRAAITDDELLEAMRADAGTDDLGSIRAAYVERNGRISFVRH